MKLFRKPPQPTPAEIEVAHQQRDALQEERDELRGHAQRLHRENEELRQNLGALCAIEAERDELKALVTQFAADLESAESQLRNSTAAAQEFESQRNILAAERDELKAHLVNALAREEALRREVGDLRPRAAKLWAPPGHFYSPIIDPQDRFVQGRVAVMERRFDEQLPGIPLDDDEMLSLLRELDPLFDLALLENAPDARYRIDNETFSYSDALILSALMRRHRPKRIVEIGSGFSSAVMMDVNDRHLDGAVQLDFYDPEPDRVRSLLKQNDRYIDRVHALSLQCLPDDLFRTLESDDFLFIDSSHVAKCASDVNDYVFRILPLIRPGVLVHIHDIFYPFEYPREWIVDANRSWNEAYLVRAFLQNNSDWRVVLFNDYVLNKHRPAVHPALSRNTGGGLWITRGAN